MLDSALPAPTASDCFHAISLTGMTIALTLVTVNYLGKVLMKNLSKLLVAILATTITLSANADPIAWDGNGNSYDVITNPDNGSITWNDARDMAEELGGHLVTITSQAENRFVAWLVATYGTGDLQRYWLGGYQTTPGTAGCEPDKCWAWVTGEAWSWDNWWLGEPNNGAGGTQHYLHYWRYPGWFDDMENRAVMDSFVVEYSVPEPGTLGLLGLGLLGLGLTRRSSVKRQLA